MLSVLRSLERGGSGGLPPERERKKIDMLNVLRSLERGGSGGLLPEKKKRVYLVNIQCPQRTIHECLNKAIDFLDLPKFPCPALRKRSTLRWNRQKILVIGKIGIRRF